MKSFKKKIIKTQTQNHSLELPSSSRSHPIPQPCLQRPFSRVVSTPPPYFSSTPSSVFCPRSCTETATALLPGPPPPPAGPSANLFFLPLLLPPPSDGALGVGELPLAPWLSISHSPPSAFMTPVTELLTSTCHQHSPPPPTSMANRQFSANPGKTELPSPPSTWLLWPWESAHCLHLGSRSKFCWVCLQNQSTVLPLHLQPGPPPGLLTGPTPNRSPPTMPTTASPSRCLGKQRQKLGKATSLRWCLEGVSAAPTPAPFTLRLSGTALAVFCPPTARDPFTAAGPSSFSVCCLGPTPPARLGAP